LTPTNSSAKTLNAGQKYNIKIEFREDGGGAVAKLYWTRPGGTSVIIPQSQLYPTATLTALSRSGWSVAGGTDWTGPWAWDGNTSTRWTSGAAQTNGQSFAFNLGSTQTFSQIVLDAGSGDYPRGYQVFVSNDGTNWGSAVATGTGSSQTTTITLPSAQTAKYIKIVQTGSASAWWSIAEINVYN
jgi:hypothetical protein